MAHAKEGRSALAIADASVRETLSPPTIGALHPSTAGRVTALIYLSDDLPREIDYATHLLGARPTLVAPDQVRFDTPRGKPSNS